MVNNNNNDNNDDKPIGVFDSGVGGLTVVKEVIKCLPNENIVYFGDTARVPYGSKSKETITKFSKQIVRYLLSNDVKAIIVACGTASSNSYDELVHEFQIPIFEMVRNGAAACAELTKNKIVGVIGTEGTIRSGAYERAIKFANEEITVYSKACPLFVPLAEEGWTDNTVANITSEIYLTDFIDKQIDTIVLGCTHYPLLQNCIQRTLSGAAVVNPAVNAAYEVKNFLENSNLMRFSKTAPYRKFYASDNTNKFNRISRLVLNDCYEAEKVDIEKY